VIVQAPAKYGFRQEAEALEVVAPVEVVDALVVVAALDGEF
jgi:hypothetical protein